MADGTKTDIDDLNSLMAEFSIADSEDSAVTDSIAKAMGTDLTPDNLFDGDDDADTVSDARIDKIATAPKSETTGGGAAGGAGDEEYSLDEFIPQVYEQQRFAAQAAQQAVQQENATVIQTRQSIVATVEAKVGRIENLDSRIAELSARRAPLAVNPALNGQAIAAIDGAINQERQKRDTLAAEVDRLAQYHDSLQPKQYQAPAEQPGGALAQAFIMKHRDLWTNPTYQAAIIDISKRVGGSIPNNDVKHYAEVERMLNQYYPHLDLKPGKAPAKGKDGKVVVNSYTRSPPSRQTTATQGEGGAAPRGGAPTGTIPLSKAQINSAKAAGLWDDPKKRATFLRNVKLTQSRGR